MLSDKIHHLEMELEQSRDKWAAEMEHQNSPKILASQQGNTPDKNHLSEKLQAATEALLMKQEEFHAGQLQISQLQAQLEQYQEMIEKIQLDADSTQNQFEELRIASIAIDSLSPNAAPLMPIVSLNEELARHISIEEELRLEIQHLRKQLSGDADRDYRIEIVRLSLIVEEKTGALSSLGSKIAYMQTEFDAEVSRLMSKISTLEDELRSPESKMNSLAQKLDSDYNDEVAVLQSVTSERDRLLEENIALKDLLDQRSPLDVTDSDLVLETLKNITAENAELRERVLESKKLLRDQQSTIQGMAGNIEYSQKSYINTVADTLATFGIKEAIMQTQLDNAIDEGSSFDFVQQLAEAEDRITLLESIIESNSKKYEESLLGIDISKQTPDADHSVSEDEQEARITLLEDTIERNALQYQEELDARDKDKIECLAAEREQMQLSEENIKCLEAIIEDNNVQFSQSIEQYELENSELKSKIEALTSNITPVTEHADSDLMASGDASIAQKKCIELESELEEARKIAFEWEEYAATLAQPSEELSAIKLELASSESRVQQLQAENEEKQAEIFINRRDLGELREHVLDLSEAAECLEYDESKCDTLKAEILQLKSQRDNSIQDYELKLTAQAAISHAAKELLAEDSKAHLNLETARKESETELLALKERISGLEGDLADAHAATAEWEDYASTAATEAQARYQNVSEDHAKSVKALSNERDAIAKKLQDALDEIEKLDLRLSSMTAAPENLEGEKKAKEVDILNSRIEVLETQLVEYTSLNSSLQIQLDEATAVAEEWEAYASEGLQNAQLEFEATRLQMEQTLAHTTEERDLALEASKESQMKIASLNTDLDAVKAEFDSKCLELSSMVESNLKYHHESSQNLRKYEIEIEEHTILRKQLEDALDERVAEMSTAYRECQSLKNTIENLREELVEMKVLRDGADADLNEIHSLNGRIQQLKSQLRVDQALKEQLTALEAELASSKEQITALGMELAAAQIYKEQSAELERGMEISKLYEEQLVTLKAELADAQAYGEQCAALEVELAAAHTTVTEWEEYSNSCQVEYEQSLQAQVEIHDKATSELSNKVSRLEEELQKVSQDSIDLKANYDRLAGELDIAVGSRADNHEMLELIQREKSAAVDQVEEFRNVIIRLENENSAYMKSSLEVTAEQERLLGEVDRAVASREECDNNAEEIQRELRAVKGQLEEYTRVLAEKELILSDLKASYDEQLDTNKNLTYFIESSNWQADLDRLQASHDELVAESNSAIERHRDEIDDMRNQLVVKENSYAKLEELHSSVESEKIALANELSSIISKYDEACEKLTQAEISKDKVRSQISDMQTENEKLQEEAAETGRTIAAYDEQFSKVEATIQQWTDYASNLEEQLKIAISERDEASRNAAESCSTYTVEMEVSLFLLRNYSVPIWNWNLSAK